MQKYAVVFFPKVDERIQTLREKYDPQYKVLPPHITVVLYPFEEISEEITTHIATVTKKIHKFQIRLHGLRKSFDDLLFLVVEDGKEDIQKLHDEIYTGIPSLQINHNIPFIPHITLGNYTQQAFEDADRVDINILCLFDTLALIKGDGVSPAVRIQEFSLTE